MQEIQNFSSEIRCKESADPFFGPDMFLKAVLETCLPDIRPEETNTPKIQTQLQRVMDLQDLSDEQLTHISLVFL